MHKLEKCHTKHGHVKGPQCAFHPVVFCTGFEGFIELRKATSPNSVKTLKLKLTSEPRANGFAGVLKTMLPASSDWIPGLNGI